MSIPKKTGVQGFRVLKAQKQWDMSVQRISGV